MESYRDFFQAQSGLNPIHYVTLPGAAWDAMLRHSPRKTPIHLITNKPADGLLVVVLLAQLGVVGLKMQLSSPITGFLWQSLTSLEMQPGAKLRHI